MICICFVFQIRFHEKKKIVLQSQLGNIDLDVARFRNSEPGRKWSAARMRGRGGGP